MQAKVGPYGQTTRRAMLKFAAALHRLA